MKKNYFYPETGTISVESGVIMNGSGNQGGGGGGTLDDGPGTNPTSGDWAPSRKGLYM